MSSYTTTDHAAFVRDHGLTVSPLGEKVAYILGVIGTDLRNAPINLRKIAWHEEDGIEVMWMDKSRLSTFDHSALTTLVLLGHHFGVRVSIKPYTPHAVRMCFHQRLKRDGGYGERHPSPEHALASFRTVWPIREPIVEGMAQYMQDILRQATGAVPEPVCRPLSKTPLLYHEQLEAAVLDNELAERILIDYGSAAATQLTLDQLNEVERGIHMRITTIGQSTTDLEQALLVVLRLRTKCRAAMNG